MTGYQEWGAEQRRSPGFKTRLNGRYLLADGRESRCTLTDVSVGGVAVVAPDKGAIGESVVIYVDHIGRIEGKIVRCDASIGEIGDICPGEGMTCSKDGKQALECKSKHLVLARKCKKGCELKGGDVYCN